MKNEKILQMEFRKVYPLLIAGAQRKGRMRAEVDEVACWLTGYSADRLEKMMESRMTYGDFFLNAPAPNENRRLIRGPVCGVKVEAIEEPLMREVRYMDKLVDELAKGWPMERILRG